MNKKTKDIIEETKNRIEEFCNDLKTIESIYFKWSHFS